MSAIPAVFHQMSNPNVYNMWDDISNVRDYKDLEDELVNVDGAEKKLKPAAEKKVKSFDTKVKMTSLFRDTNDDLKLLTDSKPVVRNFGIEIETKITELYNIVLDEVNQDMDDKFSLGEKRQICQSRVIKNMYKYLNDVKNSKRGREEENFPLFTQSKK